MKLSRKALLERRHTRVRRKVKGTSERPRLSVHKSLRHLYVQVIDDKAGVTLAAATTNTKSSKSTAGKSQCNIESAKKLAADLAQKAMSKGVKAVVFDKGGYPYHGVIKAFADAAREAGLQF